MEQNVRVFFVLGMVACGVVTLLLFGGGLALILFLGRRVIAPMNQRQIEQIVDDWAEENGCEVLEISDVESRDHPFAGAGKRPGIVKRLKIRDKKGRTRRGWFFLKARWSGRGYSGFEPDTLEVEFEE